MNKKKTATSTIYNYIDAVFKKDDSSAPASSVASANEEDSQTAKKQLPIEPIPIKPAETFKHAEEPIQPTYAQSKPMSHSPKISPSSIPNPNPSVISTKQSESSYSTVGGYPFSIPGYSAFQPVTHPNVTQSSSSSMQPAASSSNLVKSQSDYAPYSNTSADISAVSTASLAISSISSTQGSFLPSMESHSSMTLTSTFLSAAPITTAVSMGSMQLITSSLTMPSTIDSETSLPPSLPQSKALESVQSMPLSQSSSMSRVSLGHSVSSTVSSVVTMPLEQSVEDTPTFMQTMSSKSLIPRVSTEHCQIPSDILMQHPNRSLSTITSDPSSQRVPVATTSTLPSSQSIQRTISSLPAIQRVSVEHSIQTSASQESSMMLSESTQRMSLDQPISTIPTMPLEATMQRNLAITSNNMLPESRQQTPSEHPMPPMPNIPSDSSIQRMPLEYYMPSLQMMPPDLLMRRMQLLQYMQSLQTVTSEPSIAFMQNMPPYAMSVPLSQSTTTTPTTSIEKSVPIISLVSSEPIVPHGQIVLSTTTTSTQSTVPIQKMLNGKCISSSSTNPEPILGLVTHVPLVPPTSTIESQVQSMSSITSESTQQASALPSEQSVASGVQACQQTITLLTTSNSPTLSSQHVQLSQSPQLITNIINQSKAPTSLVQTMPLLSVMVSDQSSTSSARLQIVQPVQTVEDTTSDKFPAFITNNPAMISSESLIQRQQLIPAMPPVCTKTLEPYMTSITQMPLVQSMPYESAKLCNTSIQQTLLGQSIEGIVPSLTSTPSVVIVSSNAGKALQSMSVSQSSFTTTSSENSVQTLSQTQRSMSSDSTLQRMHLVRPLLSTSTIESDKLMLYTQTSISSETSMLQKPLVKSVSFMPTKLSTTSIPYGGHTSKLRTNFAQPSPTISTISSMPSLVSISHMPQMPTNPSMESMQRIQLQNIPFMSIVPSESNSIKSKELIPPLSLVQSMSSMTLAPSVPSKQPASSIDSMPSVSDSLQMMSSEQFMQTQTSKISTSHAPPGSTTSSLHSEENDKQNEREPALHSNSISQQKVEDHITCETESTAETSEKNESMTHRIQVEVPTQTITKEIKRKPLERFSLKTSIPISKIDIKSVPNPPENAFQNPLVKKLAVNALKVNNGPRVEKQIQRHVLIRGAGIESEEYQSMVPPPHANLTTLISAKETVNTNDKQFLTLEPNLESKDTNQTGLLLNNTLTPRTVISNNKDTNKLGFINNSSDKSVNDQNNQIVFIQNKNCANKKMILTIQQQNPQVLLKRKNNDINPLRFSSQLKKCKEESVTITEHIPSKVVALKRLHQGDCDEDDFENLITENQIYGNKIVVKEKIQGTSQQQELKRKNNKTNRLIPSEAKNIVKAPNFVYLSNVKYPTNIMMYKNNVKTNISFNKDTKITPNENKITEATATLSNANDSAIQSLKLQSIPITKENQGLNAGKNLVQIAPNKNIKTDMSKPSQRVLMSPKIRQPILKMTVDTNNEMIEATVKHIEQNLNKVLEVPVEQNKPEEHKVVSSSCDSFDSNSPPKAVNGNMINTMQAEEEVSSLDIYEKRKRLRRVKYLSSRGMRDVQKSETKKAQSNGRYIITPEKIKAEIYKEFSSTKLIIADEGDDIDSEYEDETKEYESLINAFGPTKKEDCGKTEFLSNFMLGTADTCKEILWNKRERIIQRDKIASAYIAAGRIDRLMDEETPNEISTITDPINLDSKSRTHEDLNNNGCGFQFKLKFLRHLKLKYVKPQHRAGYETTWQEILKERKRRDAPEQSNHVFKLPRSQLEKVEINTNCELKILSEIKHSVTENNNLIKKRLDFSCQDGDSIKTLTEKNFSELDRLSKMADRSVKHFSGQDTRKRDLNPGFDSANIQNQTSQLEAINFPNINIPSISKIISLKTSSESYTATSSQATSMDEPQNSAAGVDEMFSEANIDKTKDVECQTENAEWPGVEEMIRMYREFEKARKREVAELTRRNTALKVEGAHITRNASRQSDLARALLAERRNLSLEEAATKQAIQRLFNAVDVVRNYF